MVIVGLSDPSCFLHDCTGVTAKITLKFLAVTDMAPLLINFICNVIPKHTDPNWFIVGGHQM